MEGVRGRSLGPPGEARHDCWGMCKGNSGTTEEASLPKHARSQATAHRLHEPRGGREPPLLREMREQATITAPAILGAGRLPLCLRDRRAGANHCPCPARALGARAGHRPCGETCQQAPITAPDGRGPGSAHGLPAPAHPYYGGNSKHTLRKEVASMQTKSCPCAQNIKGQSPT